MSRRPSTLLAAALLSVSACTALTVSGTTSADAATPTAGPVTLLSDVNPGATGASFGYDAGVLFHGKLYFAAGPDFNSMELWVTDGTPAGTHQAIDINPGAQGSSPRQMTVLGNALYYYAYTATDGYELHRTTNGTSDSMVVPGGLNPGTAAGIELPPLPDIRTIAASGDLLYFNGRTSADGTEPWVTDGTAAGTVQLKDINTDPGSGSGPQEVTAIPGGVVFSAFTGSNNNQGFEPFLSDGTTAGTRMINLYPGPESSDAGGFTRLGDGVVFRATFSGVDNPMGGEVGKDHELFRIDSIDSIGADLVKDIDPAVDGGQPSQGFPTDFVRYGDEVAFRANTDNDGNELWITDGTGAGTTRISQIGALGLNANITPNAPAVALGSIFAGAGAAVSSHGAELWASDGTLLGTHEVADAQPGAEGSDPQDIIGVGAGQIAYVGETNATGGELWASDGTAAGTRMVAEINPGSSSGLQNGGTASPWIGVLGTTLIMKADNGSTGIELYSVSFGRTADPKTPTTSALAAKKVYFKAKAVRRKIRLAIAVSSAGARPSGPITLLEKGKVIGTGKVTNGSGAVRITKVLRLGRHTVVAVYGGNATFAASKTPKVTFKVIKPKKK